MKYIARAGSYEDGNIITIPDGSIGVTTLKTAYEGCLCVTWLEPYEK